MSNVTFAMEDVEGVIGEIAPLMQDHDRVISNDLTKGWPLDINEEVYRTLERMGLCKIFTARCDGKLVGYCTMFLNNSVQRKTLRLALEDAFYIAPEFRRGGVASKMVDFIETNLKEVVDMVHFHAPESNPIFGKFLKGKGYKKYAEIMSKVI